MAITYARELIPKLTPEASIIIAAYRNKYTIFACLKASILQSMALITN
jgi:hypothetical protein